jgi:chromosome segregation ATPase
MNFFSTLKRSLGFSDSDIDEDPLYADTAKDNAISENAIGINNNIPVSQIVPPTFDANVKTAIFNKVVEIFNASLPDFMAKSVDKEAQRKYLMDSLDADSKAYIDGLVAEAEKYCEQRWAQINASMTSEIEGLKAKADDIEHKSDEIKQKQLSADRQKRALSDRVHDLETQVARLEAEREQFELENRSLVNRLKVANVQQEDMESSHAELQRLQQELKTLRENPGDEFRKEIETRQHQIDEMTEGIESLKEQNRVSNEMLEDMRHRLAAATSQLEEKTKALDEANDTMKQYDEITSKMQQIDEVMTRNTEKIKQQKSIISSKDAEIETLKNTITENQHRIDELDSELKSLKSAPKIEGSAEAVEDTTPRISDNDLSAIEREFESEDWFTKTPPAKTPSLRPSDDPEFGYHAPKRKASPSDNINQLSLF